MNILLKNIKKVSNVIVLYLFVFSPNFLYADELGQQVNKSSTTFYDILDDVALYVGLPIVGILIFYGLANLSSGHGGIPFKTIGGVLLCVFLIHYAPSLYHTIMGR